MAGEAGAVCVANSPWFSVRIPASHLNTAIENPDSVQLAGELGRLDLISALLACIGIILGVVALAGFWMVRRAAMNAAATAAREEINRELPKLLPAALLDVLERRPDLIGATLRHDPSIMLSALPEAKEALFGDVDAGEAEEIAETVADGEGSKNVGG